MNEYRVKSFAELHDVLGRYRRDAGWIYRGHADPGWSLVPPAGRVPYRETPDEAFFRRWQSEALAYVDTPPSDDWEWLVLAACHGLATRLLAWTSRPLAAAYFSVCEEGGGDAAIYAFKTRTAISPEEAAPFKRQGIAQVLPRRVVSSLQRAIAVFTVHGPPTLALETRTDPDERLERIIIDAGYRAELLFELNQYGINRQTLFHDLDALGYHFSWIQRSFKYWAEGLRSIRGED